MKRERETKTRLTFVFVFSVRQIPVPQQRGMATSANQASGGGDKAAQAPPPQAKKEEKVLKGQPEAKKAKKEAGPAKENKDVPAKEDKGE